MLDSPIAILIAVFLAGCVLWLIWSALLRLFRRSPRRQEPYLAAANEPAGGVRQEPVVRPAAAPAATIPDAADVLALKAAIDNLARQVAALEKRLASGQTGVQAVSPPPADRVNQRVSEVSAVPPVAPDQRI
jgi:hypothetical protein